MSYIYLIRIQKSELKRSSLILKNHQLFPKRFPKWVLVCVKMTKKCLSGINSDPNLNSAFIIFKSILLTQIDIIYDWAWKMNFFLIEESYYISGNLNEWVDWVFEVGFAKKN